MYSEHTTVVKKLKFDNFDHWKTESLTARKLDLKVNFAFTTYYEIAGYSIISVLASNNGLPKS